jgi:hypothetical protein
MRGPSQPGQSTGGPHRFGGPRPAPTQGPRQDGNRSGPPSGQRSGDGRPGQGHPHGSRQPGRKRGR